MFEQQLLSGYFSARNSALSPEPIRAGCIPANVYGSVRFQRLGHSPL